MRIVVAAIGRLKSGPETELAERYRKRAEQNGRSLGLRDIDIIEIRESRAGDAGKRMIEESIALANIIPQNAALVVLDSRGESLDSGALAAAVVEQLDRLDPFADRRVRRRRPCAHDGLERKHASLLAQDLREQERCRGGVGMALEHPSQACLRLGRLAGLP